MERFIEQRKILVGHFDNYIDSTVLEAQADLSENLPSLKRYWEVRILTSGMGTLLGFTEYVMNKNNSNNIDWVVKMEILTELLL